MTLWGGLQERLSSPISELAFGLLVTLLLVITTRYYLVAAMAPIKMS